jgi:carboxymethylenebutenolidase
LSKLVRIMLLNESYADIAVPGSSGTMRVHLYRPAWAGAVDASPKFPAVMVFTEIYQVTGPVQRLCRLLAGKGLLVGSPESFHEFEAPGTILAYDTSGTDRGNALKIEKELQGYDNDAAALAAYLLGRPDCSGRLGAVGMCLGGHLAFRAALVKEVSAAVCLFPTDIHKGSLGKGGDDTMSRIPELADGNKEFVMVFGKQVRCW